MIANQPKAPWVWVNWYEGKFLQTKGKSVTDQGGLAAQSGAPWTLDQWQTHGTRAAMVFFFWPDVKDVRGYSSGKVQSDLWFDETVACTSRAYDCYRVNAKTAPKEALDFFKVKQVPSIVILDVDRNQIASLDHFGNASAMVSFLEGTLQAKFANWWKQYQEALGEIAKSFAQGKAASEQSDYQTAHDKLGFVVDHEFRTKDYSRAKDLLARADRHLGIKDKK